MKCSYCGNELKENDAKCSFCGQPVEGAIPTEEGSQALTADMTGEKPAETEPQTGTSAEAFSLPESASELLNGGPIQPKKKSGAKIALIAVAAAAVIGIGAFAMVKLTEKDPKEVVIAAFENIYTEDQVNPMEEMFGLSQFQEYAAGGSQQVKTELVLESCSEETVNQLAGGGIRTEFKYDRENQKGSFDLGVLYNNMDLMKLNLYYGEQTVMAAVPELSSRVFTLDISEGLVERLKNSPTLGPVLEDSDVNLEELAEFYQEYIAWVQSKMEEGTASDPYGIKDVWKRYQEGSQAQENFKAALTVEKAEKGSFLMDGKEVSCKGYQVHVSKDSMISFLRTSADFFLQDEELKENFLENLRMSLRMIEITGGAGATEALGGLSVEEQLEENYEEVKKAVDEAIDTLEQVLGDVEMLVHVDAKGRLASVEGKTALNDEGEVMDVTFSLILQGGSYLTQNAQAKVVLTEDGETVNFEMVKQGAYDKNQLTGDISFDVYVEEEDHMGVMVSSTYYAEDGDFDVKAEVAVDHEKVLGLSATGVISELEKGSVLHMDLDELRVDVPDSNTWSMGTDDVYVTLSGEYDLRPLSEEVTEPEGEKLDILAATEDDWQEIMMEVYMGVMDIASQLAPVMN
ncbi:MAG: zinc ribbon domain-containing protein [Lachnospiraceae bacterium]|nr:zinc ribbon domain-containing protein [Lachnospiraceae bacterium]MCI9283014.1 zinc ribbon domain-containing protein [Lachnospiraceae bacterium]